MSLIDKILGKDNNDLSSVFSNDKVSITAVDAYQKSRFGVIKTDKQMLEEFFIDIKNLILKRGKCYLPFFQQKEGMIT